MKPRTEIESLRFAAAVCVAVEPTRPPDAAELLAAPVLRLRARRPRCALCWPNATSAGCEHCWLRRKFHHRVASNVLHHCSQPPAPLVTQPRLTRLVSAAEFARRLAEAACSMQHARLGPRSARLESTKAEQSARAHSELVGQTDAQARAASRSDERTGEQCSKRASELASAFLRALAAQTCETASESLRPLARLTCEPVVGSVSCLSCAETSAASDSAICIRNVRGLASALVFARRQSLPQCTQLDEAESWSLHTHESANRAANFGQPNSLFRLDELAPIRSANPQVR